jgi:hypothetical protein
MSPDETGYERMAQAESEAEPEAESEAESDKGGSVG